MHFNLSNKEKLKWIFRYFFPASKNYCNMPKSSFSWNSKRLSSINVKLCFAGDLASINNLKMPEISNQLIDIIKKADFIIANCEGVVIKSKTANLRSSFSLSIYDQYFYELLEKIGVRAYHKLYLSLANNHSLDFGETGLQQTIDIFSMQGINTFGYCSSETNNNWVKLQHSNLNIMLQGWTHYLNKEYNTRNINIYTKLDVSSLCNSINKTPNDLYIAFPHWGIEFEHFPRNNQIEFCHELINRNVDCIIGHHSHVLQPIEFYKQGICAYSLGNFIFDTYAWPSRIMPLLEIDIGMDKHGAFVSRYVLHIFFRNHFKNKVIIQHISELPLFLQQKLLTRLNKIYE